MYSKGKYLVVLERRGKKIVKNGQNYGKSISEFFTYEFFTLCLPKTKIAASRNFFYSIQDIKQKKLNRRPTIAYNQYFDDRKKLLYTCIKSNEGHKLSIENQQNILELVQSYRQPGLFPFFVLSYEYRVRRTLHLLGPCTN